MKLWLVVPPLAAAVFFWPWLVLKPGREIAAERVSKHTLALRSAEVAVVIRASGEIVPAREGMTVSAGDQITLRSNPEAIGSEVKVIRPDRPMILQSCDLGLCAAAAPSVPVGSPRYLSMPDAHPSAVATHDANSALTASIVRDANSPGQSFPEPVLAPVHSSAPAWPSMPQAGSSGLVVLPVADPHRGVLIGLPSAGSAQ